MDGPLQELLQFLHHQNPSFRKMAMDHLVVHTPAASQYRSLFFTGTGGGLRTTGTDSEVIRDLKLLCRDQRDIAENAFKALINLADSSLLANSLSTPDFLTFLCAYIIYPASEFADLACMLLSNITTHPTARGKLPTVQIDLIKVDKGKYYSPQSKAATAPAPSPYPSAASQKVLALPLLVEALATANGTIVSEAGDRRDLHYLASVFANVSSTEEGRKIFLSVHQPYSETVHEEFALASLLPFTEHHNLIRRSGVASAIKNCAFSVEAHDAMLGSDKEKYRIEKNKDAGFGMNILPRLLLPLAGPEEFDLEDTDLLLPDLQFLPPDKEREPDPAIRLSHLETLLLLCSKRDGRETLRNSGVYEIIRELHKTEKEEEVTEFVVRLVDMLKREEGAGVVEEKDEDEEIEEI